MKVTEKAAAKINLSLDVLGKRADGYHEVKMIMTTIDLFDRIEVVETRCQGITIRSSAAFVPEDERNLAYKAAKLIMERYNIHKGLSINITKNIPVAAGLAGGSSDAAATIRAVNRLWDLKLTYEQMKEIATEIGSDVSFCIGGGTALATGRGEVITPLKSPPPCWVVLAKPPISISTADTYKALRLDGLRHPETERMLQAIEQQDYDAICGALGNVLESVTMSRVKAIAQIKNQMDELGADGVLMSGSGPTVFGLTQYDSRMHRLYNSLRGYCPHVYAVRLLGHPILE